MRNKEMHYTNSNYGVSGLTILPSEKIIEESFIREFILNQFIKGEMETVKVSYRRGYVSRKVDISHLSGKMPLICEYTGDRYDASHVMFLPSQDSSRFCLAVYIRPIYVPYLG